MREKNAARTLVIDDEEIMRLNWSDYLRNNSHDASKADTGKIGVAKIPEALTSHRPYRPAWPRRKAAEFIAAQAGTAFDPTCAAVLLEAEARLPSTATE